MKNKSFLLVMVGVIAVGVASFVIARDNTGDGSGVARDRDSGRWQLARAATTTTSLTGVTNTILARPGMIRRVAIVSGNAATSFEIHNAASITTCTAANEVFLISSNAVANVGMPVVFDLGNDWDCSVGITTVIKPGATGTVERAFISYDQNN